MTIPSSYLVILEKASRVVADLDDSVSVEVKLLAVQKALRGRGTVFRGVYAGQPHWWMLIPPRSPEEHRVGTVILDVACIGRVPQVQLVLMDLAPRAWQHYQAPGRS